MPFRESWNTNTSKQIWMSTKDELFPGESRGSFTNHNTGNYFRHGINITTNQRQSPTFRGNGNTIIVGDSQTSPLPIFPDGGGDFCTQAKSKADSPQPSTNNHSYCMSRTTKPQYLRNKVLFAVKNIRIKLFLTLLQKYLKFLRNLISLKQ